MASETNYTVKGHWPFPADMLRHDDSRAATPADQRSIGRLSREYAPDHGAFVDVEINLIGNRPNTARWESFGWSVPSDREYAFYKSARQRDAHEEAVFQGAMAKLTDEERAVVLGRIFPSQQAAS